MIIKKTFQEENKCELRWSWYLTYWPSWTQAGSSSSSSYWYLVSSAHCVVLLKELSLLLLLVVVVAGEGARVASDAVNVVASRDDSSNNSSSNNNRQVRTVIDKFWVGLKGCSCLFRVKRPSSTCMSDMWTSQLQKSMILHNTKTPDLYRNIHILRTLFPMTGHCCTLPSIYWSYEQQTSW